VKTRILEPECTAQAVVGTAQRDNLFLSPKVYGSRNSVIAFRSSSAVISWTTASLLIVRKAFGIVPPEIPIECNLSEQAAFIIGEVDIGSDHGTDSVVVL
jgi:hypothetical protein